MADSVRNDYWVPEWTVAPGEVLGEILEARQMSQAELARRMARPLKTISEIANGKAAVTPDTALQLERTLGISAGFWNGLEARYRETLARQRAALELAGYSDWLKSFPLRSMERLGLIPERQSPGERVAELLSFFEVSSPDGWHRQWGEATAQFRQSAASTSSTTALASWLRWGQREAARIETSPFDRAGLLSALPEIRQLTRLAVFDIAFGRLETLLAQVGVAVVLLGQLPGAPVSGATQWPRSDRAIIQLSLRYRSDDQFWFSVFHEIGHVATGGRRTVFVDDLFGEGAISTDGPEDEANRFARDVLIPPRDYEPFLAQSDFSRQAVKEFAESLELAPSLIVGRLQHDGYIPPDRLMDLKSRYDDVAR